MRRPAPFWSEEPNAPAKAPTARASPVRLDFCTWCHRLRNGCCWFVKASAEAEAELELLKAAPIGGSAGVTASVAGSVASVAGSASSAATLPHPNTLGVLDVNITTASIEAGLKDGELGHDPNPPPPPMPRPPTSAIVLTVVTENLESQS